MRNSGDWNLLIPSKILPTTVKEGKIILKLEENKLPTGRNLGILHSKLAIPTPNQTFYKKNIQLVHKVCMTFLMFN